MSLTAADITALLKNQAFIAHLDQTFPGTIGKGNTLVQDKPGVLLYWTKFPPTKPAPVITFESVEVHLLHAEVPKGFGAH